MRRPTANSGQTVGMRTARASRAPGSARRARAPQERSTQGARVGEATAEVSRDGRTYRRRPRTRMDR
eukprot:1689538-Pleurochrysis_carterae.AAC.1